MAASTGHSAGPGLLRLITCGSVDDGKSTLIGRLLFDSKAIFEDQLDAVHRISLAMGQQQIDLALVTDGLRAEREQGITIDVAYRYFATPARRFILADTPGHVQYTRNMVTAASTADAAVILIDARHGVVEQTRRHACLAALLGVPNLVVCVNKMDLVDHSRPVFEAIRADFEHFAATITPCGLSGDTRPLTQLADIMFIPISALHGDYVVSRSAAMPWHEGSTLLEYLDTVPRRGTDEQRGARLPVQIIIRPRTSSHHDYRGIAGQISGGQFAEGDDVTVLPQNVRSRIASIHIGSRRVLNAQSPSSVSITLSDDIDVSRGNLLCRTEELASGGEAPMIIKDLRATVVWMAPDALRAGRRVLIKHATQSTAATVKVVSSRLNLSSLTAELAQGWLAMNDIGEVEFRLGGAIACDPYHACRATGGFIIIDEASNNTIGAGLISRQVGT
jgi:sulfate adenylyltransferase large subunit